MLLDRTELEILPYVDFFSLAVEHLGEFLYQVCSAEYREGQQKNSSEGSKDFSVENTITSSPIQQSANAVQRPEHFYVYVRLKKNFPFCLYDVLYFSLM